MSGQCCQKKDKIKANLQSQPAIVKVNGTTKQCFRKYPTLWLISTHQPQLGMAQAVQCGSHCEYVAISLY